MEGAGAYRLVVRARIVRLAAAGMPNASIAVQVQAKVDTVRTWRGRLAMRRLAGLTDVPRSGRRPRFTPTQQAEVKALACQLPAEADVPLARGSCPELATEVIDRGIAADHSATTSRPPEHRTCGESRERLRPTAAVRGSGDGGPVGATDVGTAWPAIAAAGR